MGSSSQVKWVGERAAPAETEFDFIADSPARAGRDFEGLVFDYLNRILRPVGRGVRVRWYGGGNDRGRDIAVFGSVTSARVFGLELYHEAGLKICIQCKHSRSGMVDGDSAIASLNRAARDGFTHYVIVTNRSLTPLTEFQLQQDAESASMKLCVVNGWQLCQFMARNGAPIEPAETDAATPLSVSYQTYLEQDHVTDGQEDELLDGVYLTLTCRNLSARLLPVPVVLESDKVWNRIEPGDPNFTAVLGPYESKSWRLSVRRAIGPGIDDLIVRCAREGAVRRVVIDGVRLNVTLSPPLFGQGHRRVLGRLKQTIHDSTAPRAILLTGPAGCGKSRLLEELRSIFFSDAAPVATVIASSGQSSRDIWRAMSTSLFGKARPLETFDEIASAIRDSAFHGVTLVVEDTHNASTPVLRELRDILENGLALPDGMKVVVCGRSDDSYVNAEYSLLLEAAPTAARRRGLEVLSVQPFTPDEAMDFVSAVCPALPTVAKAALCDLGQGLPFNIICWIGVS